MDASKKNIHNLRVAMLVSNPCTHDSRVIKMAESLAKTGVTVSVFCTQKDGISNEDYKNGVYYHRVKWIYYNTFFETLLNIAPGIIRKILRKILNQVFSWTRHVSFRRSFSNAVIKFMPDVIHAHDLVCLPTGVYCSKKTTAKIIYDAHEIEPHRNPPLSFAKKNYVRYLEKYYAQKSDTVITVNKSCAIQIAKSTHVPLPTVILNAPILSQSNIRSIRKELGLSDDIILLGYVGKIAINRGLNQIIDILPDLPSTVHLTTIGPNDPKVLKKLRTQIKNNDLNDRVHILPAVPHHELVNYIKDIDLGVCPIIPVTLSYYYSLPSKVLEMTVANIPIVSTNLPEIKSFLNAYGKGYYFSAGNLSELKNSIFMAIDDMKHQSRSTFDNKKLKNDVSWDAQEKKLIGVYQNLFSDVNI